jgi:hypothetical protein
MNLVRVSDAIVSFRVWPPYFAVTWQMCLQISDLRHNLERILDDISTSKNHTISGEFTCSLVEINMSDWWHPLLQRPGSGSSWTGINVGRNLQPDELWIIAYTSLRIVGSKQNRRYCGYCRMYPHYNHAGYRVLSNLLALRGRSIWLNTNH